MTPADGPRDGSTTLGRALLALLLIASAAYVLLQLRYDIAGGGNSWKQGDWLINSLNVDVRRGPFGTVLLLLSDVAAIDPLLLVALLQAGLVILLYLLTWLLLRDHAGDLAGLLLVTSPALFVLFWAADAQGSLRKELIVFVALLAEILALKLHSRTLFVVAAAAFVIAVLAHEANVLFLPLFLFLALADRTGRRPRMIRTAAVAAAILSAAALAYAITYNFLSDTAPVCAPLLERGLPADICTGAVAWLSRDAASGAQEVWLQIVSQGRVPGVAIMYVLAMAVFLAFATRSPHPARLILLLIVSGVPFLVLYPITVDWGRWMSFHAFSMFAILAHRLNTGELEARHLPLPWLWAAFGIASLFWAPGHMGTTVWGGAGSVWIAWLQSLSTTPVATQPTE